jgi:hypothetical protein
MHGLESVVHASERHAREQVLAIAIPGKRARLAHQPANHVTVVDVVIVFFPQARHRLDHLFPAAARVDRGDGRTCLRRCEQLSARWLAH